MIALIAIYWPARHARHYDYIDLADVYDELLFVHVKTNKPNLKYCDYEDVIVNNSDVDVEEVVEQRRFYRPKNGNLDIPVNSFSISQFQAASTFPEHATLC